ncbi:hypothetical protein B0H12DRAFT_1103513 [Mycena haematopus]|nr:hypothetical protein B0H12DRAFT_1103513 [Mycena haematopus]
MFSLNSAIHLLPPTRYNTSLIRPGNLPTFLTPSGCHTKNWNDTEKISMAPAQG